MGLASELAAPTQMMIAASRSPSYKPASSASLVTGPSSRIPAAQSGSGISGRSRRTWPISWPPKIEPEDHPHHHGEQRQEHVEPERPAEGVTGPTRHHHHRRRPHDEEQQQRVGGERRCRGQPDRPGPPGERVQVTRQGRRSGHGASDPPSTTRQDRAPRDGDREQPDHAPGEGGRHAGGTVRLRVGRLGGRVSTLSLPETQRRNRRGRPRRWWVSRWETHRRRSPCRTPRRSPCRTPCRPSRRPRPGRALRCESPGDSLAIGDAEGVPDAEGDEDVDGLDGLDEG